jgi:carboxymethylenebutenolidase
VLSWCKLLDDIRENNCLATMSLTEVQMKNAAVTSQKVKSLTFLIATLFLCAGYAAGQNMDHHHVMSGAASAPVDETLTQDWARQRLAKSTRHQEWVKVKNGNREVSSFVVYPEVKNKATAVVVIHEIFGMTDWVQSLTDELAEAGYIAIAPDLLSGMGPNGGGTTALAATGSNAVGQAIRGLPPDQITSDLNAVADYVSKLPAANGKVVVAGFCWGGSESFRFATNRSSLKAAFVFYGSAPANNPQGQPYSVNKDALARINAPVYGFYAENDMRIGATVPPTTEAMKALNKKYEPVTYAGAGHGFMRAGDAPAPASDADQKTQDTYAANKKARDEAWVRWQAILKML